MRHRTPWVLTGVVAVVALVASACGSVTSRPRVTYSTPDSLVVLGSAGDAALADDSDAGFCAGVAIARRKVLTAARCLRRHKVRSVNAGVLNRGGCRVTTRRRAREASRVSPGPATVVRLKRRLPASVEPLALGDAPTEGDHVVAWGWGPKRPGAACVPRPERLRVLADDECSDLVGDDAVAVYFCAVPEGDMNTCPGDRGGPVVDAEGRLVGITVGGRVCGSDDPARYWSTVNFVQQAG